MKIRWDWLLLLAFLGYAIAIILTISLIEITPIEELGFHNLLTFLILLCALSSLGIYIYFKIVYRIEKIIGIKIFTMGYIIPILLLFYSPYIGFIVALLWTIVGNIVIHLINLFRLRKRIIRPYYALLKKKIEEKSHEK